MTPIELPKVPLTVSERALFRYRCVSEVLSAELGGVPLALAVAAVRARAHYDPRGQPRGVSRRSLYRWLAAYRHGGLAALEPAPRKRTESSTVLDRELIEFVRGQKTDDPKASIPEIIRRARVLGIVAGAESIDRSTLYRAARRMRLPVGRRRQRSGPDADVRRFAFPHRMMMMLVDGKHFVAGPQARRRVAFFFLDDATRLGLDVVVGTAEAPELFARGLYLVVRRFGIADMLYFDRGPGFIAAASARLCRQCHILPILGRARCPECHGKIEKFNQYAKATVLRGITDAGVDDRPEALELRLRHFLFEHYNHKPHQSLGAKTPVERWEADPRDLHLMHSEDDLRHRFLLTEKRSVSHDHVLSVDGTAYEVPRGHGGTVIEIYRCALEQTVSIIHDDRLIRLHPVDVGANATARRASPGARTNKEDADPATSPIPSAARLAFERDLGPVTDREGGFVAPTRNPTKKEQ
ncbi:MAG: helix-turn-helix domain-containing protein [Candidatus Krumholzibacteriia bacterium]